MRFTASARELAAALALAATCGDARGVKALPALEAVHLRSAAGPFPTPPTPMDHPLVLTVPASVEKLGEIAVSGSRLAALAAGFPADATLAIASDGTVARIASVRSHFRLPMIPLHDLPP